jgi:Kef-type K+ transport system membrane component KefB
VAQTSLAGGEGSGFDLVEGLWWEVGGSIVMGAVLGWLISLYLDRWKAEPILFILGAAVIAAWLADHLHLEVLLMALTTGLFVENVAAAKAEPFLRAVEANSIPFYALFFFLAGAGIHLDALAAVWALVVLLVGVRAVAIWGGTRLGATLGGAEPSVRRWAWTGFVSQAGVTLGMVTIAERTFPAWGADMAVIFVAMVALHELGGPVLFQRGLVAAGEVGRSPAALVPEREEEPLIERAG